MKKILIALDYTPSAERVAETGHAIAKAFNAELTIIHVITEAAFYAMDYAPIMGYTGGYTMGAIELATDIKKEAEVFLAATVTHLGDNSITTKVLDGNTADTIIKYSQEWKADLIVAGSHSHHGIERLFSTDIASFLLKHSTIPLLTIPTEEK